MKRRFSVALGLLAFVIPPANAQYTGHQDCSASYVNAEGKVVGGTVGCKRRPPIDCHVNAEGKVVGHGFNCNSGRYRTYLNAEGKLVPGDASHRGR